MSDGAERCARHPWAVSVVVALCLGACVGEQVEIENAVLAYNLKLTEALSRGDASLVEFFASSEEQKRVKANIAFISKDSLALVSENVELRFLGSQRSEDGKTATVETEERWRKHLVDARTGMPLTKVEETRERNTYRMRRLGQRWVVDGVTTKR